MAGHESAIPQAAWRTTSTPGTIRRFTTKDTKIHKGKPQEPSCPFVTLHLIEEFFAKALDFSNTVIIMIISGW